MKRFLAFLGTGNYQPCRYRSGGRTSPEVVYVQTAVNLFAEPRCEEAVVFCTTGAKAKHWDALVAEFKMNGLPAPRIVDIPDGSSEEQLWEIFRIIRDTVGDGDEIVFDVTHSLRSLPVIMTVVLRYLTVVKGVSLGACLYGAFDARNTEENIAPVFDLTPFFALDDWTRAILAFEDYGDPASLKNLATRRLGPLCRSQEPARRLNASVKTLARFAENVRLANLGVAGTEAGIRNMALRTVARTFSQAEDGAGVPELAPVLERVSADFAAFGDRDLRNGFRAARWAARHGLVPQACTLLQETAVSVLLETGRGIASCAGSGIAAREFVSGVLSRASLPDFDWDEWAPAATRDDARSLKDGLPPELPALYARLVRVRNAINHAGTNPQEPVCPHGSDFSADNCIAIAEGMEAVLFPEP